LSSHHRGAVVCLESDRPHHAHVDEAAELGGDEGEYVLGPGVSSDELGHPAQRGLLGRHGREGRGRQVLTRRVEIHVPLGDAAAGEAIDAAYGGFDGVAAIGRARIGPVDHADLIYEHVVRLDEDPLWLNPQLRTSACRHGHEIGDGRRTPDCVPGHDELDIVVEQFTVSIEVARVEQLVGAIDDRAQLRRRRVGAVLYAVRQ
jgi:hypothetical protein